jgi:hypothetical protein
MKATTAYVSESGKLLTRSKSKALAQDADDYETCATAKTLLQRADKNVSPGRLMRLYRKLWRIRCAYINAAQEEEENRLNNNKCP